MIWIACFLMFQAPQPQDQPQTPAWSATTHEAAATEANKKVLAEAKPSPSPEKWWMSPATPSWASGARRTRPEAPSAWLPVPPRDSSLPTAPYILMPEPHHPRRDGKASLAVYLSERMAQTLTLSGMASDHGGIHTLFIPLPADIK